LGNNVNNSTGAVKGRGPAPLLEFEGGIHLCGTGLWFDATSPRDLSFVSHAHKDHFARHRSIIATEQTIRLCREREEMLDALPVPYGQPFSMGELTIELYPAGHMLGSAQILVQLPASRGGLRIGYTGDFNTAGSLTAGVAAQMRCDVLVMEATFGEPRYVFPSRAEIDRLIAGFIDRALSEDETPVLFAYTMGKAQELIKRLDERGCRVRAQRQIWEVCRIYQEYGVTFSNLHKLTDGTRRGEVVVAQWSPFGPGRERLLSSLRSPHTAVVTGWAIDQSTKFRYGVDEAFPLSDHADFNALTDYARGSGAGKIYVIHGSAELFSAHLRSIGLDAEPLVPPSQLSLF
jgi:putative mRNA 3-end processing factor